MKFNYGAKLSDKQSVGLVSYENTWDATYGKTWCYTDNTFTNTYMISDCKVLQNYKTTAGDTTVSFKNLVDGENWATPTVATNKNHTESGIKRYLSVADMFDNVYYNENGTVNETATKTENDWTKFNAAFWNIDAENKTISWR